jgi:acetyl-CoA carboxylase carboxyl transferase subunit beta
MDTNMSSSDPLAFIDSKPYLDRIAATQNKTSKKDAVRSAFGK